MRLVFAFVNDEGSTQNGYAGNMFLEKGESATPDLVRRLVRRRDCWPDTPERVALLPCTELTDEAGCAIV